MKWIILSCLLMYSCMNNQKNNNSTQPETTSVQKEISKEAPNEFKVKLVTSKGDIILDCHKQWAPIGVNRLYHLIQIGFYNNVRFFRYVTDFVVQFGISGDPKITEQWKDMNINDDPVKQSNKTGTLSFATAGPNTRTTQLFINLVDNARLDPMGFAPLCSVSNGINVINKLYSGYGEAPSNHQSQIESEGNKYLNKNFPSLDYIIKAEII